MLVVVVFFKQVMLPLVLRGALVTASLAVTAIHIVGCKTLRPGEHKLFLLQPRHESREGSWG